MGVPNGSCICDDGLYQRFVSKRKSFFLVAPGRAWVGFFDVEAFRCFGGNVFDIGADGEERVESDYQDFGVFV